MNKKLLIITLLMTFAMVSCKKSTKQDTLASNVTATTQIKAPLNFTWQNSRNINFTVNVTDTRFQSSLYMVSIYDGDPTAGGNLLAKGSATTTDAFKSKIYLSAQIIKVYIVKTSPDNSKTTLIVQVGATDIVASIG
jgi:hypothetical protein